MEYNTLKVTVEAGIARVIFNRPDELNTLNPDFWREFPQCVTELDSRGDVKVMVLSSTGKHFCAGMDLSVFAGQSLFSDECEAGRRHERMRRWVFYFQEAFTRLEELRMPVLAAIQGGCVGGGLDMVTACDMRYCTEDAFFSIKETQLGMTADLGTLQRLPHLIPVGAAKELAYTGRKFSASEAKELGLVNCVYKDQDAMIEGVMDIAGAIAANSPLAVHGCKEMINYTMDHTVADSLKYMATWQSGMFQPTDMMKSFAAKAQKEPADFDDLLSIDTPFDE